MATTTISGMTLGTAANLTGAAVLETEDSTGASVYFSMATLRTKVFAGGTGYTAADPLTVGPITSSGDSTFGGISIATSNQINESATNASAGLYLNYSGYQNGSTQFRDLLIGNGKGVVIASFIGLSGRCILANDIVLGAPSGTATNGGIWFDGTAFKCRTGGVTKTFTIT